MWKVHKKCFKNFFRNKIEKFYMDLIINSLFYFNIL